MSVFRRESLLLTTASAPSPKTSDRNHRHRKQQRRSRPHLNAREWRMQENRIEHDRAHWIEQLNKSHDARRRARHAGVVNEHRNDTAHDAEVGQRDQRVARMDYRAQIDMD